MFPSIILTFVFVFITSITLIYSKSIVIEVKGDCATAGEHVAREHGYRVVRQVRSYPIKSLCKHRSDRRFSMDFVKLKKIHRRKIIYDIDELSKEESIRRIFF